MALAKDNENGKLSKSQAQAKWKKDKAVQDKLKAYEAKARAEVEAEVAAENKVEPAQEEKPKMGRPKKSETK